MTKPENSGKEKLMNAIIITLYLLSGILFNLGDFKVLSALVFAVSFVLLFFSYDFKNNLTLFVFLLLSAVLVHFRTDVYLYFDEWTVAELFMDRGWQIVNYRHNEHYLPLFFVFYMLETKIFGLNYWLYIFVSIFLHALNAYLVYLLCLKLELSKKISNIICCLFVISPLHSEVLHWAFEQSLLICSSLMLFSLIKAISYLKSTEHRDLYLSVFSAVICPFVFGNGFSIILLLPLAYIYSSRNLDDLKQLIKLIVPVLICFVVSYFFYFTDSNLNKANNLKEFIVYLATGTQLGVVLRGMGLFPVTDIQHVPIYFVPENFKFYPEFYYALHGLAISLALFFVAIKSDKIKIWLTGFIILIAIFLLPAITRAQFGAAQSLSLRYDYLGVFALCLMFVPVFLRGSENKSRSILLGSFMALSIFFQLKHGKEYRYFSDYGIMHRRYVEELIKWKCSNLPEEQLPTFPETIYPGHNKKFVLKVLDWFDSNVCD